jgi:hypothetical protein
LRTIEDESECGSDRRFVINSEDPVNAFHG